MAESTPKTHGRFQIGRCLGEGASGVVFRALDTSRDLTVAVKVLTRINASSILRFKSEFRSLANITHPNLLQLYDLVASGQDWLLSMELIEGGDFLAHVRPPLVLSPSEAEAFGPDESLAALQSFHTATVQGNEDITQPAPRTLPRKQVVHGPLDEARLRVALLQLCEGLAALHKAQRLHRDLKPANVLVSEADGRVVICDFGLVLEGDTRHGAPRLATRPANDTSAGELTTAQGSVQGEVAGTLAYMSPEQANGWALGAASDWYAVGAMLYQALTRRLPYDPSLSFQDAVRLRTTEDPPHVFTLVPDAPADLAELAMALLQREATQRPGHAAIIKLLDRDRRASAVLALDSQELIGREQELAQLNLAFANARGGQASLALVAGRSGMGKTSLMRRFLHQAMERDAAVVLAGRCYEREDLPYKAFDPLLDALSSYLLQQDSERVEKLLPDGIGALVRLFPVLSRVPAIALSEMRGTPQPVDRLEQKRLGFSALRELLRKLSLTQPLILFVDDLQWGDLDSAPLFAELLRPPQAPAMLLVCAYRAEDEAHSALLKELSGARGPGAHTPATRVNVQALSNENTRRLANALLVGAPHADASAELIVREAGGSPFFVGELASYIRQTGHLVSSDLRLDTVIQSRLSRLPADARHLLAVIAVAGRPERRAVINQAAGLGGKSFQALRVLESQSLVQATGAAAHDHIECYHDRIRETAYQSLDELARSELHAGLARVLSRERDVDSEALLHHYRAAGEPERAGEHAIKAAEKAERALAFGRAAALYREAIELTAPVGEARRVLDEQLGHTLMLAGHGVESAEAFFRAVQGAPKGRAMELRGLGTAQLLRSGLVNRAFQELVVGEEFLRMRTPLKALRAVGMLLWRRLLIKLLGLRLRKAPAAGLPADLIQRMDLLWAIGSSLSPIDQLRGNVYQAEHLLLAIKSGDPYRFARALAIESTVHGTRNDDPGKTQHVIDRGLEHGGASREPHALSAVKGTAGTVRLLEGRFREAQRLTREAQDIIRDHLHGTLAWDRNIMVLFELRAVAMLGNVSELALRVPELLRDAEARGDLFGAVSARTSHLCWAWLGPDQLEQAETHVRLADERWAQQGYHLQHWYTTQAYAEVALYRGDVAAALVRLTREWKALFMLRSKIQYTRAELLSLRARLKLASAREQGSDRSALLAQARSDAAALRREQAPWIKAHAVLMDACVASFSQKVEARRLLRAAEGQFDAVDMALHAAVCGYRYAQLEPGDDAALARAEARIRALGVAKPAGFARMLAPGAFDSDAP